MTARDTIAAALAGVPQLHAVRTKPRALAAGHAWPHRVKTEWRTRHGACTAGETTWYVYVVLPGADPIPFEETVHAAVPAALAAVGAVVDEDRPVGLEVEDTAQPVPAIEYTIRTPSP